MKKIDKKSYNSNELQVVIRSLTINSSYVFKDLYVDNQHFGNVVVVFKSNNILLRIIQDRNDIYFEKSMDDGCTWLDHNNSNLYNAHQYENDERLIEAVKFMLSKS